MPESIAIRFENVSKIYKLHGSQLDQLIEVLGLQRIGIKPRTTPKEFSALSDVSFEIPRGHRIGIVGRNGAGKTTLLKLISGNFTPTLGSVEVNGGIQALMNVGLGFHPEYTGRQNVEASLQYNGLGTSEYKTALDGIIDFCELGDFLDQPFKTYSLGMQARLMFAAATAIKPDILIVDEVLGAGDAYFLAKSKARVEKLVSSGCTMLLVSHSMQQILELCDEVIWIDRGSIRMRGDAFLVVKAYEEYLQGSITELQQNRAELEIDGTTSDYMAEKKQSAISYDVFCQEPVFKPHENIIEWDQTSSEDKFDFIAPGGLSNWGGNHDLRICGFTIESKQGVTNRLISLHPVRICVTFKALTQGNYRCRYAIAVYDHMGKCLLDVVSPSDEFYLSVGERRAFFLAFNPLQLGPGEYIVSTSLHEYAPLEVFNSTPRYDLLSRSFAFSVELPETLRVIEAQFYHSAEWHFQNNGVSDVSDKS